MRLVQTDDLFVFETCHCVISSFAQAPHKFALCLGIKFERLSLDGVRLSPPNSGSGVLPPFRCLCGGELSLCCARCVHTQTQACARLQKPQLYRHCTLIESFKKNKFCSLRCAMAVSSYCLCVWASCFFFFFFCTIVIWLQKDTRGRIEPILFGKHNFFFVLFYNFFSLFYCFPKKKIHIFFDVRKVSNLFVFVIFTKAIVAPMPTVVEALEAVE